MTTPELVFEDIYRRNVWGGEKGEFYSGDGSHQARFVEPYVDAVAGYLSKLSKPPIVVDLGCGDFNASRRLVSHAARFIGCDASRKIVQRNRQRFPQAQFQHLDFTSDVLPAGDICIVKQVFQHLDNDRIGAAVRRMMENYDTWIITEHIPAGDFTPNLDMEMGGEIRVQRLNSGIDLTAPPFDFHFYVSETLCEVDCSPFDEGIIRTEVLHRGAPPVAQSVD